MRDQTGRCVPRLLFRQGTSKKGLYVVFDERAGREMRLQTEVLIMDDTIFRKNSDQHAIEKMWFTKREWLVPETSKL